MLVASQKIFDPIGFTSPTTLIPKLLIQKTWKEIFNWDKEIDEITKADFSRWIADIPALEIGRAHV